jgi:hypothetical protein
MMATRTPAIALKERMSSSQLDMRDSSSHTPNYKTQQVKIIIQAQSWLHNNLFLMPQLEIMTQTRTKQFSELSFLLTRRDLSNSILNLMVSQSWETTKEKMLPSTGNYSKMKMDKTSQTKIPRARVCSTPTPTVLKCKRESKIRDQSSIWVQFKISHPTTTQWTPPLSWETTPPTDK